MVGSVGLEVMSSSNSELNWKTVTKGRRSRKSTVRNFNANGKTGNSTNPQRVGDFLGSDFDKLSEAFCVPLTSSKSENVPLKKRMHLLQTPRNQDAIPPRTCHLSEHNAYLSSSGQRTTDWQAEEIELGKHRFSQCSDHISKRDGKCDDAVDFFGIELLAAAASMYNDDENDNKMVLFQGRDPLIPKQSDASSSPAQLEIRLNSNPRNSMSNMTADGGNADYSRVLNTATSGFQSGGPVDVAMPKVNRQHWDLNTLMDAWDEPYDDSVAGNTSKDVNDGMHMENGQVSIGHELCNQVGTGDEPSDLKLEEKRTTTVSPDTICHQLPGIVEHKPEPPCVSFSDKEQNANLLSPNPNLSCDTRNETLKLVVKTDSVIDSSEFSKPCCTTGKLMPQEKIKPASGSVVVKSDEDCSHSLSKIERTVVFDAAQTASQDTFAYYLLPNEASEAEIEFKSKVVDPSVLQPDELAKHEENSFPIECSKDIAMESLFKNHSAGAKFDDSTSAGKVGPAIDAQNDSDVSQDNHLDMDDGDDLQEGYDSPYEDGELRGSFLYSFEDNELQSECVDYEFDGRNEYGSDVADYLGSEIVEGGSDGSHGTQRRNSTGKRLPDRNEYNSGPVRHFKRHFANEDFENNEKARKGSNAGSGTTVEIVEGGSDGSHGTQRRNSTGKRLPDRNEYNSGPVRHFRRHFANEDFENNEKARKGSNAGSGTTVEQSMELNAGADDGIKKRRHLADRKETIDVKIEQMDKYASKPSRVKLHSRIEGQSCPDATNKKDAFVSQPCRQRRLGFSYSRLGRDRSPDRHLGRYRPAFHGDEREVDHQWTSWSSRRRYASGYQGYEGHIYTKPRSINGDLDKISRLDPYIRQNMAKGLHRPVMRSTSERDEYFAMQKRVPLTRGFSGYRSRGHYSQRDGRDFADDFEPLPDDTSAPVHMSRYIPRREWSFSPNSGTRHHMLLPCGKSRSRSRTRSPRAWRPHKERIMSIRRQSGSPDFRSDARMERVRVPFSKGYGDEYISPSRGCFSLHQNSQWVDDDHAFSENNHIRHRGSPVRVFRCTQRFDSIGRLKEDEYLSSRPMIRPGRFPFKPRGGGGRESKFESNYDDRRCGENGEMIHRGLHASKNGHVRRFQHNVAGDFGASNLNNEDDGRVADRDDKRAIKMAAHLPVEVDAKTSIRQKTKSDHDDVVMSSLSSWS